MNCLKYGRNKIYHLLAIFPIGQNISGKISYYKQKQNTFITDNVIPIIIKKLVNYVIKIKQTNKQN